MLKLIETEFLKLRRRKMVWLMLLASLIMPFMAFLLFNYRGDTDVDPIQFYISISGDFEKSKPPLSFYLMKKSNLRLPDIVAQCSKVNIWTFTQNLSQTFFRLFVQLRLFQIIQQKENVKPPANRKKKFFIRG